MPTAGVVLEGLVITVMAERTAMALAMAATCWPMVARPTWVVITAAVFLGASVVTVAGVVVVKVVRPMGPASASLMAAAAAAVATAAERALDPAGRVVAVGLMWPPSPTGMAWSTRQA